MGSGAPISAQSLPSASADGIRRARSVHSHYHPRQRMGSGEPDQPTVSTIRVSGWDQESPISAQSLPSASADGIRRPDQRTVSTIRVSGWDQESPISPQSVPSASAEGSGEPD